MVEVMEDGGTIGGRTKEGGRIYRLLSSGRKRGFGGEAKKNFKSQKTV